ncbi:Sau3AI family type II restriction endonuclease [Staphylococcus lutrae]|uniref:Sau3AI family type II restriction endonuclease n=1 Tax=Staphylococcus lutrae TaxID=155085 RepID=UPI00146CD2D2|nr:Sau3AI family type II restriction endonuclease [Staphylococcus lutrae]
MVFELERQYLTKEEVHNRAIEAKGMTLEELSVKGYVKSKKSSFGDAFENWFGKSPDNESKPDMEEAGVELKATPFKKVKNNKYSAKERLVLNMINYHDLIDERFDTSHFLMKNGTLEIAFYENEPNLDKKFWSIKEVILYQMRNNKKDFEVIKKDWEKIKQFVEEGRAHELSERHFQYLSPCTKGKNGKTLRTQPKSDIKAKSRAFSLKAGFVTALLRDYVFGDKKSDSIIKNPIELEKKNIYELIEEKFEPYIGWSLQKLCDYFEIPPEKREKNKRINNTVAMAMLNLNGNNTISSSFGDIEEFEKASIAVKTVQFNQNNKNKESMSFPAFKFKELANEEWENELGEATATWHSFLLDTHFLFVVFKEEEDNVMFKGVKFHSIPEELIETTIKSMWEDTKKKIRDGVQLTAVRQNNTKDGWKIKNNFITLKDDKICHVRPHTNMRDYTVNGKYSDELPTAIQWTNRPKGESYSDNWMTKQCFWLNNSYINEQVKDLLK